jgi:hypothetical protein
MIVLTGINQRYISTINVSTLHAFSYPSCFAHLSKPRERDALNIRIRRTQLPILFLSRVQATTKNRRHKVSQFLAPADWSQRRRVPGSDLCLPQDTTGSQRYAASHAAVDDGRHGHGRLEVEEEAHGAVALVVTRAEEEARGRRAWKRASYSAACSWMTSRQATN